MVLGKFITIEGCNGSGKSFLRDYLFSQLTLEGFQVFKTKLPSPRFNLKDEDIIGHRLFEKLLIDRKTHIEEDILPALNKGQLVLCDRYVESSFVYQRIDGMSVNDIWDKNCKFLFPDLCLYLRIPSHIVDQRLASRKRLSRFERKSYRLLEREYYEQAVGFLKSKGFKYFILEETSQESLLQLVQFIQSFTGGV